MMKRNRITISLLSVTFAMSVILSALLTAPVSADNKESALADGLYAYEAFNSEWRRLYDDIVSDCEELIVNADEVAGTVFVQNGVAVTGDNGKFIVDGMTYSTSDYDLTYDEILSVMMTVRYCNPQYYFISSDYFRDKDYTQIRIAITETYAHADEREAIEESIASELEEYIEQTEGLATDYEKIKAVHDMMVDRIEYAYDENGYPRTDHWAHNIIGAVYGAGTCETYSKWFSYVLTELGIGNYIVTGTSSGQGHAWNIVQMDDGKWYYIDVTWDDVEDTIEGIEYYYGYFAVSSSRFAQTHTNYTEADVGKNYQFRIPKAEDTYAYSVYEQSGSIPSFESVSALRSDYYSMWAASYDKGERTLVLYATSEDDAEMLGQVISDLDSTVSELRKMGYNKYLSGTVRMSRTTVGGRLFIVTISGDILNHTCEGYLDFDENGHYWTCSYCGEVYESESHNEITVGGTPPTCTEEGLSSHVICSDCGYIIEHPERLPASHRTVYVKDKAPDCANHGYSAHYECELCSACFADESAQMPITHESTLIAPTGKHTGGKADCTHKAVCTVCKAEYGDFASHDFTAERIISRYLASPADCHNPAYYYYGCHNCDKLSDDTFAHGEKLAHDSDELWKYNALTHWQTCMKCSDKLEAGEHHFDNSEDAECICGFVRSLDSEGTTTEQAPPTTEPVTGTTTSKPITDPPTTDSSQGADHTTPSTSKPTTDRPVTDKPTVTTPKDPVTTTKPATKPSTDTEKGDDPIISTEQGGSDKEDEPSTEPDPTPDKTTTTTQSSAATTTTTATNNGGSDNESDGKAPLAAAAVVAALVGALLLIAIVVLVILLVAATLTGSLVIGKGKKRKNKKQ